jgi:DNA-binding YbaB/EbfC family protein
MNPFDLGGLSDALEGMQRKMQELRAEAARAEVTGEAGGGAVQVTANGDNRILAVRISAAAMEDRELLEDLVRAATNEALRKAGELSAGRLSELAAGLPLPPGLLP